MDELMVTFPGGMKVDVEFKGHLIRTDQPVYAGGEGKEPAPFDLFLASIAACAGYYLLAFCQSRGLATQGAGVVMGIERDPQRKMIGGIELQLQLPAGFPERYLQAVIKAVDTCSVKAHILNPPVFRITARQAS